ncbi:hypothetical protein [Dokdonella soli]|uniref:Big-1 domain-containing protein n=1 Tax=Dokdonella soli TaxID=529810 RepID=A0ABN1IPZ6_9GAMM
MKFFGKTLGLLLASLVLASCGGGGGGGGSGDAFQPPQSGSITLTATTTTLPLNTAGYDPAQRGAPTQAEVTIVWRNANGTLVNGHDIAVSISPITVAAISCLAAGTSGGGSGSGTCATTSDLYGSVPITGINGQATVFVNSRLTAGTTTLVVTATDPTTGRTVSASLVFTVTSGVGSSPASVTLTPSPTGIYLPSSGGTNSSAISATVRDGGGQLIPDPVSGNSGVDNIQFEIIGNAGDARLSTNSVSGSSTGTKVSSHTVHGVATASFQAGDQTPQGPIQIRATVDRADNNVSNGIQDPVTFTTSVIVSDGKLYSIQVTSPVFAANLPGITINCVTTPCVVPTASGSVTPSPNAIPTNPDATLSLVVSAKAQDRQGNPVLPGTPIRFGSVDTPVGAPGSKNDNQFLLSGIDGNPQEGGTLFTAPTGQFTTGGGGAGPGDALVVFGKAVQGNDDLESAVTVQSVTSATSLVASPGFNLNDTTGVSVDYGPVLPYLIGRSQQGSVTAQAVTDAKGVVHASLTYTVKSVGNAVAIWAQGDGVDRVTNGPRRVTDAGVLAYPGVAPATISASPDPILGDTTATVTVCVADALGIPLRGQTVSFQFALSGGGTGTVDGQTGSGTFAQVTGVNGCATGNVVTTGVPASAAGATSGSLKLSAAGKSTSVGISVQIATLQVSPNSVSVPSAGVTAAITVTARTASGGLVPGVLVTGTCTASGGLNAAIALTPGSATTSNAGTAMFSAVASGFVKPGSLGPPVVQPSNGTGTCVFTASGNNSATVTFNGTANCATDFSPPSDPSCHP